MHKFVKAAGLKSEKEFYEKYKTEDDFFKEFPQFKNGGSINPYDKGNQGSLDTILYRTPLPQHQYFPASPTYKNGGIVHAGTGTELKNPNTGTPTHKYYGISTNNILQDTYSGLDALITESIYNPRVHAAEYAQQRDLMRPITGFNNFYGDGMGMYARGGQIDQEFVTNPSQANALVESKETIQTTDGKLIPVTGEEYHSDKPNGMGGKFMSLDPGTRIYSKRNLIPKEIASSITGTQYTSKQSPSKLVRKYDTKKEEEVLNSKYSDPISIYSANQTKGIKDAKKEMVFNAQELAAGRIPGIYEFGGTLMAGKGGMIHAGDGNEVELPDVDIMAKRLNPIDFQQDNMLDDFTLTAKKPVQKSVAQRAKDWIKSNTSTDLKDAGIYTPEAVGLFNALKDQPITAPMYQPVYNKAHKMNIQADLNRNLSLALPALQRSYGDFGVDSARRMSALSSIIDSSNQLGQSKSNYDSNQQVQTDNANNSIENNGNLMRIQQAEKIAMQIAQRNFNKDKSIENIVQSGMQKAYDLKHSKALENNSLAIMEKMYPNWKWYNGQMNAVKKGDYFHYGIGPMGVPSMGNFDPTDGYKDSETIKVGNKTYKRVEENN